MGRTLDTPRPCANPGCAREFTPELHETRRGSGLFCCRQCVHAHRPITHGASRGERTPEYRSWKTMRNRCNNPRTPDYADYGGRGITVCERWGSFVAFLEDMGPRPRGTTIDRIENDRGYEPGNCRWATVIEQANNRRNTRIVEFRGQRKTVRQWSAEVGLAWSAIQYRLDAGWPVDAALTVPSGAGLPGRCAPKPTPAHEAELIRAIYCGGGITQAEVAKRFGVSQSTVSSIVARSAGRSDQSDGR